MSGARKNVDGIYRNLISFVPEQNAGDVRKTQKHSRQKSEDETQGEAVKHFYESLLTEDSGNTNTLSLDMNVTKCEKKRRGTTRQRRLQKARPSSSQQAPPADRSTRAASQGLTEAQQREVYKLLHSAETGDTAELSRLVHAGLDINLTDMYGWTPLMCAAKAGHVECARLCLMLGADRRIRNSAGGTAEDLARTSGHFELAAVISSQARDGESAGSENQQQQGTASEPLWCEICQMSVSSGEHESHKTSTVHLFNMGHKPAPPAYLIPSHNRGFQMLVRTGWEQDRGLGPRGEGQKYPVRTVLKHDRKGLGVDQGESKKSKVTHFNAFDKSAVSQHNVPPKRTVSARKAAQNAVKAKERRSQRWERNIRSEFSG